MCMRMRMCMSLAARVSVAPPPLLAVPLQHQAIKRPCAASQHAKTPRWPRGSWRSVAPSGLLSWLRDGLACCGAYCPEVSRKANSELSSAGRAKTPCCERRKSSAETTRIFLWRSRHVPNARAPAAATTQRTDHPVLDLPAEFAHQARPDLSSAGMRSTISLAHRRGDRVGFISAIIRPRRHVLHA
jgi:hypothetical protein